MTLLMLMLECSDVVDPSDHTVLCAAAPALVVPSGVYHLPTFEVSPPPTAEVSLPPTAEASPPPTAAISCFLPVAVSLVTQHY